MGRKGGQKSRNGGYASEKIGKDGLTGRQRAELAGRAGGMNSGRNLIDCEHNYPQKTFEVNGHKYEQCTNCQKVRLV